MVAKQLDEQAIFEFARKIGSAEARQAYLQQVCGEDPELEQRIATLLRAYEESASFLESPPLELAISPAIDQPPQERLGTQIGPYKLLQVIGEGGMGVVYMAEQSGPMERRVALKIIKPGMDSRQVIARFEAERQALAMMDHPNIAKVFDASATDTGRPYVVMELVKGVPITQFCDDKHLTLKERLVLFVPVCQAIQHAHQKGIIHRDIKPTNVLVALYDEFPVPKVIDFGVAKATAQKLTEKTMFTGFGQLVGTLEYMSPEQAQFNQLDIDTRSDIYSLGVLLYELLTGTTPFEQSRLRTVAFDETLRIIREEEPPKPSTRLSSSDTLPTIAANRHTEPARLSKAVRGELDWIVMKALEKDRNRRYETVSGLAMDLRRFLLDEPVQACPPSPMYRFRKFAGRNKRILGTIAIVAIAFLLAVGSFGWMLRDRAARRLVAEMRVQSALDEATRLRDQQRWADARDAARRAELLLPPSESQASLRRNLSGLLADLDMVNRLERARLSQTHVNNEWWDLAGANPVYAAAFLDYGIDVARLDAAGAAERVRNSAIREQLVAALDDWIIIVPAEEHAQREQLRSIVSLADPDEWRNRFRMATIQQDRTALEELASRTEVSGLPPSTVVLLGRSLQAAGAGGKAVEVLSDGQRHFPTDFWLNIELASMLRWHVKPPRYEEAVGYCRAALAVRPDSPGVWVALGSTLRMPIHVDEAIAAFGRAIALKPDYAEPHHRLGRALAVKGEWAEAVSSFRDALRLKPEAATVYQDLGRALRSSGDLPGAASSFRQAVALEPDEVNHWASLGTAYLILEDRSAHRRMCTDMVNRFAETNDAKKAAGVVCNCVLIADALDDTKPLVRLGYVASRGKNGLPILGAALYRAGDYKGARFRLEHAGSRSPWDLLFLAMAHHQLGNKDQARACLDQATSQLDANRLAWPEEVDTALLRREAEELIKGRETSDVASPRG